MRGESGWCTLIIIKKVCILYPYAYHFFNLFILSDHFIIPLEDIMREISEFPPKRDQIGYNIKLYVNCNLNFSF